MVSAHERRKAAICVCVPPFLGVFSFMHSLSKQGARQDTSSPGNEAGDVSEDMEMECCFHVPALL